MKYRADIDGLRAVAVLPVVFYHAGISGPSGGFVGVDIFFVISGFLITSIVAREIAEGRFSLLSFYERRARRILPALAVVIFATFAVGWFVLLPNELNNLGQSAFASGLFLSNVFFAFTLDYFSDAAEFSPLLHTWSLAVEEQFYIFFPPLLALVLRMRLWRPFWIVCALSVLSFFAAVILLPSQPDWVFYFIFFRTWELGIGAMLALCTLRPPPNRTVRELLAVAGLAAILISVFTYDSSTLFPGAAAVPPVIGAAVLIWIGMQGGGSLVSVALANRFLVWIGLISYSLYLWHWPIFSFLRIVKGTTFLSNTLAIAAISGSVGMAWVSFRFVERPFRAHPSKGLGRRAILFVSAVSLSAIMGVGFLFYVSGGLPARLPASVVALAEAISDRDDRHLDCFRRMPADGLCAIGTQTGSDERLDFLLWGDSHANSFMPGMDQAAERVGQSGVFAGYTGCAPVFGVQRPQIGQGCTTFKETIWSWLNGRTDIPVVILAARWPLYVEGTRYRGESGGRLILEWTGGFDVSPAGPTNADFVETGLSVTVDKILASGRKVILLGSVPEIGYRVPAVLARYELLGWKPPESVTLHDFEERAGRSDRILRKVALERPNVHFIPLSELFCDENLCRTLSLDGKPLYVDADHISQTAALRLLSPRLEEIWEGVPQ